VKGLPPSNKVTMDRVLPVFLQDGIGKVIEYAYSFEPMFAPTVVLGECVSACGVTWGL